MKTNTPMQTNKNLPYYVAALGVFVLLKFGFRFADNDDLVFLLKPADMLVGILTGSCSVYLSSDGYYHEKLNVFIGKSCCGFNFWVLCFLLFAYLAAKHFEKPLHKAMALPGALVFAYLLTVFVNSSRIFVSIAIQNQTGSFMQTQQSFMHEAIGIITNLSFLVLAFFLTEKILKHTFSKHRHVQHKHTQHKHTQHKHHAKTH
jgi:exosortase K